jgi:hypothetical protein
MKRGVDTKFVNGTDYAANVMTQNLTQDFVPHRHIGFTPYMVTKLGLNHHDCGFNVATFVVMSKELLSMSEK